MSEFVQEGLYPGLDPNDWFQRAYQAAGQTESFEPCRAALATADGQGRPSVRYVLVKQIDAEGFVFYTNHSSPKARQLLQNPWAELAFHWSSTGVQVRVSGAVSQVSSSQSDAYFASRPRGSQVGAWASQQSQPVADRAALDALFDAQSVRFETGDVPRPEGWGGFRLRPDYIEFWRARDSRLHDRWRFDRSGDDWQMLRLQP